MMPPLPVVIVSTSRPSKTEMAGWRRMYFEIRSMVEAGRARIGLPASQRFRSSASSWAVL